MKENTFGDYKFEEWIPERERELVRDFWGQMGRTHKDWLEAMKPYISDFAHHGPSLNGFQFPPLGATVDYYVSFGGEKWVRGRFFYRWNNMGSLIGEDGERYTVSTGDRWVRVFTTVDEKKDCGLETNGADDYMEKRIREKKS